jgi:hypothetical protein
MRLNVPDTDPKWWRETIDREVEVNLPDFQARAEVIVGLGAQGGQVLLRHEMDVVALELLAYHGFDAGEGDFVPRWRLHVESGRFFRIHDADGSELQSAQARLEFVLKVATFAMLRSMASLIHHIAARVANGALAPAEAVKGLVEWQSNYHRTFFPLHTYRYHLEHGDEEAANAALTAYSEARAKFSWDNSSQMEALKAAHGEGGTPREGLRSNLAAEVSIFLREHEPSPGAIHRLPYDATNAVVNAWRPSEYERQALRIDSGDMSPEIPAPQTEVKQWEEREALRQIIESAPLSRRQREVILLYLQKKTETQIAAELKVTLGTVRKQKGRAYEVLRQYAPFREYAFG